MHRNIAHRAIIIKLISMGEIILFNVALRAIKLYVGYTRREHYLAQTVQVRRVASCVWQVV